MSTQHQQHGIVRLKPLALFTADDFDAAAGVIDTWLSEAAAHADDVAEGLIDASETVPFTPDEAQLAILREAAAFVRGYEQRRGDGDGRVFADAICDLTNRVFADEDKLYEAVAIVLCQSGIGIAEAS